MTMEGFRIGEVSLCSSRSAIDTSSPNYLIDRWATTGFLLGTNDVMYAFTGYSPGSHKAISLYSQASADFDILARCGALPTTSAFDGRQLINSQEWVDLGNGCTGGATLYVAIHAFSGSGAFTVVASDHNTDRIITAGTNFSASSSQLDTFEATLRDGIRHFYGATEGYQVISRVDLFNNTGSTCGNCGGTACDICFENSPGTGFSPFCGAAGLRYSKPIGIYTKGSRMSLAISTIARATNILPDDA